ncbi:hypothetical protein Tco_0795811 [Tanacetum coccineum]
MFLNMDQLEKQLDKEEFQEIGSMAVFKILETQFQTFIKSQIYFDDECVVMTCNYFLQYTQLEIRELCDTLIQHMEYVKRSIAKRALHKREYDSRVNERHMQTTEEKVDTSKALDANIKPIYDEEPMAEVQLIADHNVFATGQHHTEQPEFNNEGEVDQNTEQCHDTWKPVLQPHRNQSVVRQPTAFKSEQPRILKPRFASQVDVNNDLPKPFTTHYLPKGKESACAKPHHMITPSSSRYSSNDMVHNHYLEEAKKKTQESDRNSRPSVMPSARSQSTANGSKPKPRINNQKSRNWPASKKLRQRPKWVPTEKIFTSSTTKVDSEPPHGSNIDITNLQECIQTLDSSAGTSINV